MPPKKKKGITDPLGVAVIPLYYTACIGTFLEVTNARVVSLTPRSNRVGIAGGLHWGGIAGIVNTAAL
jgi:hypothetical protein